jgi:hypothetical protein
MTLGNASNTAGITAALVVIALALVVLAAGTGIDVYKTWFADEATTQTGGVDVTDQVVRQLGGIEDQLYSIKRVLCVIADVSNCPAF